MALGVWSFMEGKLFSYFICQLFLWNCNEKLIKQIFRFYYTNGFQHNTTYIYFFEQKENLF